MFTMINWHMNERSLLSGKCNKLSPVRIDHDGKSHCNDKKVEVCSLFEVHDINVSAKPVIKATNLTSQPTWSTQP